MTTTRKALTAPAVYALSWAAEAAKLKKRTGKAPPAGRAIEVPTDVRGGLRVVVYPSGAKSWAMRFRRPSGRAGNLTLGPVDLDARGVVGEPVIGGPLTLAAARRLATRINHDLSLGRDPIGERAAEKAKKAGADRTTFGGAARAFLVEHAIPKTRYASDTASILGFRIDGASAVAAPGGLAERWADKPLAEIDVDTVLAFIAECRQKGIPGRSIARGIGPNDSRERAVFAVMSKFFGWCVDQKRRLIKVSPMTGLTRPGSADARERVLNDDEVRWFWAACDELGHPFGTLFQFLLLTGARRDEGAALARGELSEAEDGTVWTIPGSRTKNKRTHRLPLPALAAEVVRASPTLADSGLAFTTTGTTAVSGFSKMKAKLDAAMARLGREERGEKTTIPEWRVHDLRRTAASNLARLGTPIHVTERILNHVSGSLGGIVAVYQKYSFEPEMRRALEAYAGWLGALVGRSMAGKVMAFKKPA